MTTSPSTFRVCAVRAAQALFLLSIAGTFITLAVMMLLPCMR